jgi:hypothetical protein
MDVRAGADFFCVGLAAHALFTLGHIRRLPQLDDRSNESLACEWSPRLRVADRVAHGPVGKNRNVLIFD